MTLSLNPERRFPRSEYWHGSQEQQYFYCVAQGGIFGQVELLGGTPASPSVEL